MVWINQYEGEFGVLDINENKLIQDVKALVLEHMGVKI